MRWLVLCCLVFGLSCGYGQIVKNGSVEEDLTTNTAQQTTSQQQQQQQSASNVPRTTRDNIDNDEDELSTSKFSPSTSKFSPSTSKFSPITEEESSPSTREIKDSTSTKSSKEDGTSVKNGFTSENIELGTAEYKEKSSKEEDEIVTLGNEEEETSTVDALTAMENEKKLAETELDYYSMPPLSELDDFDLCLRQKGSVYCIVDMELMEDDSPLYQYIKNFSTYSYKNYRHSKLHRGVCAHQHCGLNTTHAKATGETAKLLKQCFNESIHQRYGLEVDSLSVRYCKTQNDWVPPDTLDYVIGVLILVLLLVNLGCSAHYYLWPSEKGDGNRYMLAFTIQKNWKALKHGGSAEGGIFKCFQALRFYTMVMILGLHSMIFIGYGYTANPEFIEHSYSDFFKSLLFNARIIVQIFFVMGGFLMAYKMLIYAETHPFSLRTVPMALVNRWLRLMPAVLVVAGLAMTWVPHMGSGPMWDAVVGREREMCRNNWWQLAILSPNLFPFEYLCLPQAWYLGTDTQLFLVTLVVLLIIWRWPKSAVPVLSFVMAISLLIPFLQSYFMKLLPIRVSIFPESIRDIFGYNDTFYHAYVSAQGNWAGYHLGVLTAYFYHKAQTEKWDLRDSVILKLLFLASVPIAFGTVLMGWDLHHREASAFEAAVFNALNQNFFALAMCIFIIGYFYRANSIYVNSVEWGPLQPLGRLSYCAMLVHATVLRTYGGQMRRSFYATDYTAIMLFAGIVCTTYLFSLPLHLFVEAPFCNLQKIMLGQKRTPKEDQDSNGNQVKPGISTISVATDSTRI